MAGTKLACPHCKAILKSSKVLPKGKRIVCVQCKQTFALASEMLISNESAETHDGTSFALAETHAGTMKSPIAGVTLPAPKSEPPPEPVVSTFVGRHRTPAYGLWLAVGGMLLFCGFLGCAGLAYFLVSQSDNLTTNKPDGEAGKLLAEVLSPTNSSPAVTPKKSAPPTVEKQPIPPKRVEPLKKTVVPVALIPPPKKKIVEADPTSIQRKAEAKLQQQIDESTRKGVEFLKRTIQPTGTWQEANGMHTIGYAALPALAMLECGVKAEEPVIQQAAAYVRSRVVHVVETYDLGVALLFLDRLGDPADKKLIQLLALRVMAGQTPSGGWTYECPVLNLQENDEFLNFLRAHKPEIKLLIPLQGFIPKSSGRGRDSTKEPDEEKPQPVEKKALPPVVDTLPRQPKVRGLPIVSHQVKKIGFLPGSSDDNSNTHFALLGLWAARRHDLPVESSLELAAERFQKTQAKDGGWGYVMQSPPKNTMTCVGLVSLAMGHGSAADLFAEAAEKNPNVSKTLAKDPAIHDGLKALGMYLDGHDSLRGLEARIDLYYLWSMERVGMLYRQKKFGKTDWFEYGAKQILERQDLDGSWKAHYDAPVDTAFALLFLRRSDLVEDLTNRLHSYLEIPNATLRTRAPQDDSTKKRDRK